MNTKRSPSVFAALALLLSVTGAQADDADDIRALLSTLPIR